MRAKTQIMLLATLLAAGPAARSAERANAAALPVWMSGCWLTTQGKGPQSEECWTPAHGAMMLGSGHMFDAEKSLSFEHMRIVREGATIIFIAQPGGAPPTRFLLAKQIAPGGNVPAEVTFVNDGHDYPQRVTYRLVGTYLTAEIAMKDGSKPQRWQFRRAGAPAK